LSWGTGVFTGKGPDYQSFFASFLFTKKKTFPCFDLPHALASRSFVEAMIRHLGWQHIATHFFRTSRFLTPRHV